MSGLARGRARNHRTKQKLPADRSIDAISKWKSSESVGVNFIQKRARPLAIFEFYLVKTTPRTEAWMLTAVLPSQRRWRDVGTRDSEAPPPSSEVSNINIVAEIFGFEIFMTSQGSFFDCHDTDQRERSGDPTQLNQREFREGELVPFRVAAVVSHWIGGGRWSRSGWVVKTNEERARSREVLRIPSGGIILTRRRASETRGERAQSCQWNRVGTRDCVSFVLLRQFGTETQMRETGPHSTQLRTAEGRSEEAGSQTRKDDVMPNSGQIDRG
ncbi:hypothetical protein B0H16DRAFT_1772586 [Mycena metata]|uniref:Uncharacterized protein n=1 Tax=Mycena metata TaxID=1033252 RepID=A0AAD7HZS6_9AGAR|nr:hypothetical protein B0H16DRAFT_1772586 [Mycena metata]